MDIQTQNQAHMPTLQQALPLPLMNLITNKNIDWEGNCLFEDGMVSGFKRHSASNNFSMRPVPENEEARKLAEQALPIVEGLLKPATTEEIAIAIKRLSLHCGMQGKAPQDVKAMFMDYCKDLQEYPFALLEDACTRYRTSEGNKFMPSSGQLITLMQEKYRKLKLLRARIGKILKENTEKENTVSVDNFLGRL